MTTRDEIPEVLSAFAEAEREGDTAALDGLLAADFAAIGPLGFTLRRADWLERHESKALRYETFAVEDTEVRRYGSVAIVTGRQVAEGAYGGRSVPPVNRVTYVLDSSSGTWRFVACHLSFVAGTEGAPPMPGRP